MIQVKRTDKRGILPSKSRNSDSGYDLNLIEKVKSYGEVELYETYIAVKPPKGYYFDMVPRSSIIKSGYMLANSVGIIDMDYRGSIKVPLIKVDKSKPDLELPIRLVQLIPRKIEHFQIIEVNDLEETERGGKGFGSSGK
jgi:dUTP pyrophosphatase